MKFVAFQGGYLVQKTRKSEIKQELMYEVCD